jgi:polar amino acid transport system substrate-binding protein
MNPETLVFNKADRVDSIPEKGLAVELVNKALQRKGYQPTLHIYNWQRALEGVEIGVFDATCAIWKTAERERDLLYSEPYLTNKGYKKVE